MHSKDGFSASFGERVISWSTPCPRGEHAGMEGREPGPSALPTLEQMAEKHGVNQRPGASDTVASRCVLSPSLAKDLTRHMAAWLQITVDCQEQPRANVLPSCCELQSCHSTCKES